MRHRKVATPLDYVFFALLAFGGFLLELPLQAGEALLFGAAMGQPWQLCVHWAMLALLWGTLSLWLVSYIKACYSLDLSIPAGYMRPALWAALSVYLSAAALALIYAQGYFKPMVLWAQLGPGPFLLRYLALFPEAVLFTLILALGQRFGESFFWAQYMPWGGLCLAISWGLLQTFTQGVAAGATALFFCLLAGLLYLLVQKSTVLTTFCLLILRAL